MENKKRCPKCGEENPPEAVMCWACYTPLTNTVTVGAAGAGAKAGGQRQSRAQTIDDEEDEDRKPAAQPWQIAVIAIGLIFALFMVGKNFLPSGSGGDDALPPPEDPAMDVPASTPSAPTPTSTYSPSNSGSVPAPQKLPFTIAVAPNPNITVGTMAIVPTDPNISTSQAAALASFTRSQFTQMKRWDKMYIYVFRNRQSAQQFANYQRSRRGAPLTNSDYSNLTNLWGSALSCYEYNHGSERIYTPSNNPSGWWSN